MIDILSTGAPNLIQDAGRRGHLGFGVSRSGAMDALALAVGNSLVGNDPAEAAVEISLFPFRVRFQKDLDFAVTGADCVARLDEAVLAPWWSRTARSGQTLVIERPRRGARAYLCLAGGVDVEQVMGSRSTDLKGAFGGFEGRGLKRGDALKVRGNVSRGVRESGLGAVPQGLASFWDELVSGVVSIRVVPAAEYQNFSEEAKKAFATTEYEITPEANRVGYRLNGANLPLTSPLELLSHGIVPGTIQVPPSGQPIIQLAEANTCGGYPKIATVIESDLWKLGQAPVGCRIRFTVTDIDEAVTSLGNRAAEMTKLRQTLALMSHRG
ncbi:biotin-dependent carboxyltransferase family protein [Paraburkholderia fungorum]|uniref:5-oxoprolinase subunit C family protein n=1 Tax=Paraburkholderia fungorum TaxID=134537 RepID=UPI002092A137|nr:biotin-dependent carboxyltransferase family protein [Paraburkholderia fungorum]USU18880.1 biotin-dependent carboxyltransferase family protein [Paraburkholderia fungorum]USU29124.1 biotin-dependent carboxyltransferase family protein [Paraburkholderia fungorum]